MGSTDGMMNPGYYRRRVGAFEAVALHDGVMTRDRPPGFVRNASEEAVGEAFAQAGMARDKLTITFTPLAVQTDGGVVLIDTGFGDGGPPGTGRLLGNLAAAGIDATEVIAVIISHCHGDHVAGLRAKDGSPNFPNAQLFVPKLEWAFWMDEARAAAAPEMLKGTFELVQRVLAPWEATVRLFEWGETLLPGFTALDAGGHSPGMAAIDIVSEGERLLFVADITNNPLLFARNPTWQVMFDMDPERATETRLRILDQAAAEKTALFFFHAPFPGFVHVVKTGDRYEILPALWQ